MHLAKAQVVKKPTQLATVSASLYVAMFFVVAVVLQLFAFEDYPSVIDGYNLPLLTGLSLPLAAVIVSLEVLAIPYLLWMKLSPLMRLVSFGSGWLIILYWLAVGMWQSTADFQIGNAGLFGAKVVLPQGWWLVSYSAILLILMAYVTWTSKPLVKPTR